jgi:hypothetical protein
MKANNLVDIVIQSSLFKKMYNIAIFLCAIKYRLFYFRHQNCECTEAAMPARTAFVRLDWRFQGIQHQIFNLALA